MKIRKTEVKASKSNSCTDARLVKDFQRNSSTKWHVLYSLCSLGVCSQSSSNVTCSDTQACTHIHTVKTRYLSKLRHIKTLFKVQYQESVCSAQTDIKSPKALQFMHQLFWIKMSADLLGAVTDRGQHRRPVTHVTDISINQTNCETLCKYRIHYCGKHRPDEEPTKEYMTKNSF